MRLQALQPAHLLYADPFRARVLQHLERRRQRVGPGLGSPLAAKALGQVVAQADAGEISGERLHHQRHPLVVAERATAPVASGDRPVPAELGVVPRRREAHVRFAQHGVEVGALVRSEPGRTDRIDCDHGGARRAILGGVKQRQPLQRVRRCAAVPAHRGVRGRAAQQPRLIGAHREGAGRRQGTGAGLG